MNGDDLTVEWAVRFTAADGDDYETWGSEADARGSVRPGEVVVSREVRPAVVGPWQVQP